MKELRRRTLATLAALVTLFVASAALAKGEACFIDTDCPGTACGDAVCNWTTSATTPEGRKTFGCNPAGSQTPVGSDGWCEVDADCKCASQGAKCVYPYCTFTQPKTGAGGSSAGGSVSTGGTTSSGGSSAIGGAASGGSTTAGKPASDVNGGCSVSMPRGAAGAAWGVALLGAGLGLALARRRR